MIIAERKSFEDIKKSLAGYDKVLILGCGTCTSVCMAGGEREVAILATELRMAGCINGGKQPTIGEITIQRQCDREYIAAIAEKAREYNAVLSLACGAGVQLLAEMLDTIPVIPGLNTKFIGITDSEAVWTEKCRACGECVLGEFGGICPITICAKGLINGPCGGARKGKCEQSDEKDCAWELIYNRLKKQGKLDNLKKLVLPRDHRAHLHPGKVAKYEPAPQAAAAEKVAK